MNQRRYRENKIFERALRNRRRMEAIAEKIENRRIEIRKILQTGNYKEEEYEALWTELKRLS